MGDELGHDGGVKEYKAFVGGIPWSYDSDTLKQAFAKYGAISADVMIDKMTNKPRGFGFVTFSDDAGLQTAIAEMHNTLLEEKKISVTEAVPQDKMPRPRRDYGDRGYGGYSSYGARGGYDRGYNDRDRRPYGERPGGYADRSYPPRYDGGYGAERGGYGGYGADRALPPREPYSGGYGRQDDYRAGGGYGGYDRPAGGYDRGYSAPAAGGYDRGAYGAGGYDRPAGGYGGGYDSRAPPRDPYAAGGYGAGPDRRPAPYGADRREPYGARPPPRR